MRKLVLEISIAAALTLGAIVSLQARAHANEISVTGAYARASASPAAKAGAAYFTVVNQGREPDRIIAASADVAENAMLHESAVEDGVATMRHVGSLEVPPGTEVALAPGGLHVMLAGLKKPLQLGERFTLTLTFERAGSLAVDVPVAGVAANAPP
jgi:copper(I)-binding protein